MRKTIYLLLVCLTGFLFSCSEDESGKSIDQHQQHVKMNKVSFQDNKLLSIT